MPFFPEGQDPAGRAPTGTAPPDPFMGPTPSETIGAAFRQNNPVASVLSSISKGSPEFATSTPGYDPIPRVAGTKYEPYLDQFIDDRNADQTNQRMARIDGEQKDQETLAASGTAGTVASLAAGATDPSWLIPILGEARAGAELGLAARALRGAAEGAGKSLVSEAGLQGSQATRTAGEGIADVATNTLLMGLLGGATRWFQGGEHAAAAEGLEKVRADLSPLSEGALQPPAEGTTRFYHGGDADPTSGGGRWVTTDPEYARNFRTFDGAPKQVSYVDIANDHSDVMAARKWDALDEQYGTNAVGLYAHFEVPEDIAKGFKPYDAVNAPAPHIPVDVPPTPRALASDLSAASSDQRDMQLSRIGLPATVQDAMRSIPGAGPALDFFTAANMRLSPTLRVFSSGSIVAKRAMGDMAETALRFTQSERGVTTARGGVPLDRLVKMQQHDGKLTGARILRDQFLAYRKVAGKLPMAQTALADARGTAPGMLSFADFKKEVTLAASSGDAHDVPEIATAARQVRSQVLDPITKMAQNVIGPDGKPMLSDYLEPPKGDKSFFPRLWNKQAIAAKYNQAKGVFADWLEGEQARKSNIKNKLEALQAKHDALPEDAEGQRAAITRQIENEIGQWGGHTTDEALAALKKLERVEDEEHPSAKKDAARAVDKAVKAILGNDRLDLDRGEIESRAAEIVDRINAAPDGRIPYDIGSGGPQMGPPSDKQQVRASLNARDFAIPTSLVKDFIQTDTEHVIAAHLRTAIPDIHLTDRFGDVDMEDVFRRLNEEYDAKRSATTGEKKLTALDNERKAMNRDLAATRDRLREVYGWELAKSQPNAARIANVARNYNLIADLGTSVFNRMTDSINAVYRHGFMNVLGDGYVPFFKSMVGIEKDFAKSANQSMHDMGVGVDSALGHLSHQFGDVMDSYQPGSKFERGIPWSAEKSMMLNLHGPWTDGIKTIAGTVAAANLLRTAEKATLGTASQKEISQLAMSGIEPFMARRIWEAFQKDGGGQTFGKGTHVANTASWSDAQARSVFSSAIARDADMSVLTPGLEKPLWMSHPIVSLLGQYKSFISAAHEKILISNLQQMDGRTLQGLAASLGMGMLSYRAYTLLSGAPASDRPQDWIKEGISRSAILGWFTEINSMQAKFTGGATDMFRAIGADHPLSRRATNGALSELLGPTYSKLEGLAGGLNDASHGTWTAMDTHKLRQSLFLQNLFAVRKLFDSVEDGFNNHLGIKPLNRDPSAWPQTVNTKQ